MEDRVGVLRLLVAAGVATAVMGCRTSEPAPDPEPVEQPEPVAEPAEPEPAEPEPEPEPPFCAEGTEEYTRNSYRWCKRDGAFDGNFVAQWPEGTTELEGTFAQGAMTGPWVAYYPGGAVRWRAELVGGEEAGPVEGFYPDGARHYVIPYVEGARQGEAVFFHPNGERAAALSFEAGEPEGTWTYWYDNGQKAHEYTVKPNGKTSIHRHWDREGAKMKPRVGQLPRAQIMPGVEPLGQAVVRCYEHARVFSEASGKIVAQFIIGYGGEVSEIKIFEEDFEHPFMGLCTQRHVEGLTFPHNPYGPKTLIRSWELRME